MKYNYIGNTGLRVSELCFGTMTFGGQDAGVWSQIGDLQQTEVNAMIEEVIASGINFIDTANVYSFGQSEQLLGQALKDLKINLSNLNVLAGINGSGKSSVIQSILLAKKYFILNLTSELRNE